MRELVKAPVYQQLNALLRDLILGGEFKAGDRFLTERQVSERFGVSRATANKALSNLVSAGMLDFRKGVGTFVQPQMLEYDLRLLVSFTAKAAQLGEKTSTRVIRFQVRSARTSDPEAAERLGAGPDEKLYCIERLRLAGGRPAILERRYVPVRYCPGLGRTDVSGSLYAVWTDRYGLDITGADQTIRAVTIRGEEAVALEVQKGSPGFLVISTGYLAGDKPLWFERTLYRGDAYEFRNRLGPITAAQSSGGGFISFKAGDDV